VLLFLIGFQTLKNRLPDVYITDKVGDKNLALMLEHILIQDTVVYLASQKKNCSA
jgi:hypothetical protein